MNGIERLLCEWFGQAVYQRVGWALLHLVWQGAIVAVTLAGAVRLLRRRSANVRYVAACCALGALALLPVLTGLLAPVQPTDQVPVVVEAFAPEPEPVIAPAPVASERSESVAPVQFPAIPSAGAAPEADTPIQPAAAATLSLSQRLSEAFMPALPFVVGVWIAGVVLLSSWRAAGWARVRRLKTRLTHTIDGPVAAAFAALKRRLGVSRPVRLVRSGLVRTPGVVGWIRPVLLMPAGALTGLSTGQLQAVLAHELAHIRRYDYLVNLIQTLIETLLFYHPAVWWISHRIRAERENCCDDVASDACGGHLIYARALVAVEQLKQTRPRLAVAVDGGSLLSRIRRLLGAQAQPNRHARWLAGVIAITLLAAMGIGIAVGVSSAADETTNATTNDETPATQPAASQWKVRLSNGVTVELAGVSFHRSKSRVKQWWRPDGSTRENGLYRDVHGQVFPGKDELAHEFTVRLSDLPEEEIGTAWRFDPSGSRAGGGVGFVSGKGVEKLRVTAVITPKKVNHIAVKFGVAAGLWELVAEGARVGSSSGSRKKTVYSFSPAIEADGNTVITVAHNIVGQQVRVVAVDGSGGRHLCASADAGGAGDLHQITPTFRGLALKDIKSFQLQARPYEWVEFKNVSLKPGQKTDVQVVEGTGQPATQPGEGPAHSQEDSEPYQFGQAVEGAECKLRPNKQAWDHGEEISFLVDARNHGQRKFFLYADQWNILTEVDGRWYRRTTSGELKWRDTTLADFSPGRQYISIPLILDEQWRELRDDELDKLRGPRELRGSLKGKPLLWIPGTHTVRVMMFAGSEKALFGRGPKPIRFVSRPVTIKILPPNTSTQPATTLTCRGKVVDADGKGIAGATLRFSRSKETIGPDGKVKRQFDWRFATVQTDATGRFDIPEITPNSSASVEVSAPGFVSREHASFYLREDGTYWPDDLTIPLHRQGTLTGRVIGPDGKPLAAGPVSLTTHVKYPHHNHTATTENHMRAITGKDGRFVIEHVPPGDHLLYYPWEGPTKGEVDSGKWQAFTKPGEVYPSAPVKGILGLTPIKLSDGEKKTGITLDLSQSKCAVEGKVVDSAGKPVAKAKVALYWVAQGWSSTIANGDYPPAETDAGGRYRLQGLPTGSWHLKAWLEGSQSNCKPVPVQLSAGSTANRQDLRFDTQIPPSGLTSQKEPATQAMSIKPGTTILDVHDGKIRIRQGNSVLKVSDVRIDRRLPGRRSSPAPHGASTQPATTRPASQPAPAGAATRTGEVYVMVGDRPGVYSLAQVKTVGQALRAGGLEKFPKNTRFYLLRTGTNRTTTEWLRNAEDILSGKAEDIPLQEGDVLTVENLLETARKILATHLATTRPASPQTQAAVKGGTVTRVYDVRDLVKPMRDFTPPPVFSTLTTKQQEKLAAEEMRRKADALRADLLGRVIDLIATATDPNSWKDIDGKPGPGEIGTISKINGQLVITQNERNHATIRDIISKLRQASSLQILVETKFIAVSPAYDRELCKWLAEKPKPKSGTAGRLLSDDDVAAFLEKAQSHKSTRLLTAPRFDLLNGQRAFVSVGTEPAVTLPVLGEANRTVPGHVSQGFVLDVEAVVSADRKYTTMTLRPRITDLDKQDRVWVLIESSIETTVSVPDSGTLMMRFPPRTRSLLAGVREVTDAKTGKKDFEIVKKPLDDAKIGNKDFGIVRRFLGLKPELVHYMLIKPKILIKKTGGDGSL